MNERHYPSRPLLGAAVALWRDDRILLAKRSAGPSVGTWAMPGGLVEPGETLSQAAIREVAEETALVIRDPIFNRMHEIIIRDDHGAVERHYVLAMFAAHAADGEPVAGDDAAAVRWYALDELDNEKLTGSTLLFARESRKLLFGE